jgi:hypothetical protein
MLDQLPTIVDSLGEVRVLGTLPTPRGISLPMWADSNDILPESDWREFELVLPEIKIKDQDQRGACNGHAAATSLEIARWIAGYEHVDLSAWLIYADLCGGVDQGSSIGEALKLLQEQGTCTDVRVPWRTINPRAIGPDARAECTRFRIEIGKMQSDFAQLMTSTQLRRPGNFSIFVGYRFNELDADGCPPAVRGMGNHAVTYGLGAKKSPTHGWLIKCQNSWTAGWGKGGYFWIHEGHLKNQAFFEAYEVMAAYADPQDPHKPPVVA